MNHTTRVVPLPFGRTLTDTELTNFFGGVTDGGCIPDPMKEAMKKLSVGGIATSHHMQ